MMSGSVFYPFDSETSIGHPEWPFLEVRHQDNHESISSLLLDATSLEASLDLLNPLDMRSAGDGLLRRLKRGRSHHQSRLSNEEELIDISSAIPHDIRASAAAVIDWEALHSDASR